MEYTLKDTLLAEAEALKLLGNRGVKLMVNVISETFSNHWARTFF